MLGPHLSEVGGYDIRRWHQGTREREDSSSNTCVCLIFLHMFNGLAYQRVKSTGGGRSCLTGAMTSWDPHGQVHLDSLRTSFAEAGLIDFVQAAVTEVWRINRERHEPVEAYDDAFTLSVLSSRNLANRLLAEVPDSAVLRASGVVASKELGSTVLHTPRADVRLVKAPFRSGRRPNFEADFDWSGSEGRQAAALRNHAAYNPPSRNPQAEPLFEFPFPNVADEVTQCREVFLVWGAELRTGLTAGWLGLPTASAQRWIAVTPVWWDEPPAQDSSTSGEGPGSYDGSTFGDKPAPVPALALKPRRQEGGNRL